MKKETPDSGEGHHPSPGPESEELSRALKELASARQDVEMARSDVRTIENTVISPFVVLDDRLAVISANSSFCRAFAVDPLDIEGRPFLEIPQLDLPQLREPLQRLQSPGSPMEQLELEIDLPESRLMHIHLRRLAHGDGSTRLILLAMEDRTMERQSKAALRAMREELERRVEERTDELSRINQQLRREVEERRRVEEEVRRLNEELDRRVAMRTERLEAVNKELEMFAYSVSHDLRAPLRSICGFAQIIANRHRSCLNEEGQHYFDNIVEASAQMDRLICELLNYSRVGRRAVRRQPVVLRDLLAEVEENLSAEFKGSQGQVIINGELPTVLGDWATLKEIFTNLIENAIKYRVPGVPPRIEVSSQDGEESVTLLVRDNGIGIAPRFHTKVFEIFQRLHNQERYPGTGIGLAIVRKAVELLEGKVWVESDIGEGSTFFVQFPRRKP